MIDASYSSGFGTPPPSSVPPIPVQTRYLAIAEGQEPTVGGASHGGRGGGEPSQAIFAFQQPGAECLQSSGLQSLIAQRVSALLLNEARSPIGPEPGSLARASGSISGDPPVGGPATFRR